MYFSPVKWLSVFPVGARSKEDSWNLPKVWCRLQAPAGRVGHPHPIPPYARPLLLHGQQRGEAGPHNRNISTGQSQDAAPSWVLSYSVWEVSYRVWQLVFAWDFSAAVLEKLYKYRTVLLTLLVAEMHPAFLILLLARAAPLLALTFPKHNKLEPYWSSHECYQGSAGERKGHLFTWAVTQHRPIHQHTKIQICFRTLGRSLKALKPFNVPGDGSRVGDRRWQVFLGPFDFLKNPFRFSERSV